MVYKNLSELLQLLPERSQKNLVLAAAFFLNEIEKQEEFTAPQLWMKLKGHGNGISRMNVSAVILNQCVGLVEPVPNKPGERSRVWKLNVFGRKEIARLLALSAHADGRVVLEDFAYGLSDLHPIIREASEKLFLEGHLDKAIEAAVREVNKYVRKKTGRTDDDGMKMMLKIFDRSQFKGAGDGLSLNPLSCQSDENEQDGYRFIFAGVQQGVRNPFNHDGKEVASKIVAMEYLVFASHLARMIDKGQPA